jgi:DNA repair protein SbcD/Mre11
MWLIELDPHGAATAERVDCPVPRPLARLRGTLAELLDTPALEAHTGSWVQATLTDAVRPAEPMERLRRRFPHTLQLAFEPDRSTTGPTETYSSRLRGRDDTQIGLDFVRHVRGRPAEDSEQALLRAAFDAVRLSGEHSGAAH